MKIGRLLLLLALIAFSVTGGFLLGQQNNLSASAQKKPASTITKFELLEKIRTERIKEIKVFELEEKEIFAVIRETDEPVAKDSILKTSEKITLYDESGKTIYEHRDFGINAIKGVSFMPRSRQLMIETNGGGTDNFLKIIEFRNGGFRDLIDESETQFRGGYFTIPQYRTGNKTPYFNPAQLIVINQLGGADENPEAAVFREKDNKFQKVGAIKMQELGDFVEARIARHKPAK